jgi:hypothetical protein
VRSGGASKLNFFSNLIINIKMDLNSLLQGQLPDGLLDQLSQQIGGDKEQTANAASGIINTLLGGLAKNVGSQEGADSLAGALDRDHDGSIFDNLSGLLSGDAQGGNSSAMNGLGILQNILGDKAGGAAGLIGQMSGLSSGQSGNLMALLAPILMGALGKQKQENGLDGGGIASLLSNLVTQQSAAQAPSSPLMGLVSQFLDQDKDGSIMDDVAGMVMNNLFKR